MKPDSVALHNQLIAMDMSDWFWPVARTARKSGIQPAEIRGATEEFSQTGAFSGTIFDISTRLYPPEIRHVPVTFVPWESLSQHGICKLTTDGIDRVYLDREGQTSSIGVDLHHYPVRGGVARAAAKMWLKTREDLIDAEFPANDVDVFAHRGSGRLQKPPGIHIQDICYVDSLEPDTLVCTPDVTMNQVVLDSDGLHIADQAIDDIREGIIRPIDSRHTASHLFTPNAVRTDDGTVIPTPRGVGRILHYLLSHKGQSSEFQTPLGFDIGKNLITVVRKHIARPDAGHRMAKLRQYLRTLTGQDQDLLSRLESIRNSTPYLNLTFNPDTKDIHLWLMRKLYEQKDSTTWGKAILDGPLTNVALNYISDSQIAPVDSREVDKIKEVFKQPSHRR